MPALWRRLYLYDPQTVLVGGQARVIASGFSTHPVSATEQIAAIDAMLVSGAAGGEARGYWADEIPFEAIQGLPGVPADRFLRTGAGTALEALTAAQLASAVNRAAYRVEAVGGGANARTLTTGVGLTSLPTGLRLRARFPAANTGAMTINVDGLGAVTALTATGAAMPSGYIRTTVDTEMVYDGTNWIVSRAIERGSNANGSFVRFEDGTLMCMASATFAHTNNIFLLFGWNFPASCAAGALAGVECTLLTGSGNYTDISQTDIGHSFINSNTPGGSANVFLSRVTGAPSNNTAQIDNVVVKLTSRWY